MSAQGQMTFEERLRKYRLKRTQRNCDLWNDARRAGWEARKEADLGIVAIYTAPIHSGLNGDQCAREIFEAIDR